MASAKGYVDVLKTLVELSADVEAKTARGATPLHEVAKGYVEALKTLVELSADRDEPERRHFGQDSC